MYENEIAYFYGSIKIVGECWLWTGGSVSREGRGFLSIVRNNKYTTIPAMRFAWYLKYDEFLPKNKSIYITCKNSSCCNPDHSFLRRAGDFVRIPTRERFWGHVEKTDTCWFWKSKISRGGYGQFMLSHRIAGRDRKADISAHKLSYLYTYGEIPEGLHVLHSCDRRDCVAPHHLSLGTPQDNMTDMVNKGRSLKYEKNHKAKLTQAQVLEIRQKCKEGIKQTELAKEYNVTPSCIQSIIKYKNWKDL